ncbi:MAG: hypothetical protein KGL39_24015 [Patescibacteria group bacterium]|nr:hypothetical protein [Patescibacteria group bacterium]
MTFVKAAEAICRMGWLEGFEELSRSDFAKLLLPKNNIQLARIAPDDSVTIRLLTRIVSVVPQNSYVLYAKAGQIAAQHGNVDVLRWIVSKTPIDAFHVRMMVTGAIRGGHMALAKLLITKYPKIDVMYAAAVEGSLEMMDYAYRRNQSKPTLEAALMVAMEMGNFAAVQKLERWGARLLPDQVELWYFTIPEIRAYLERNLANVDLSEQMKNAINFIDGDRRAYMTLLQEFGADVDDALSEECIGNPIPGREWYELYETARNAKVLGASDFAFNELIDAVDLRTANMLRKIRDGGFLFTDDDLDNILTDF